MNEIASLPGNYQRRLDQPCPKTRNCGLIQIVSEVPWSWKPENRRLSADRILIDIRNQQPEKNPNRSR